MGVWIRGNGDERIGCAIDLVDRDQRPGEATMKGGHAMREPATSLLLIHGAGSGPWIFESWYRWFPKMAVRAVDLQANLDIDRAGMADYARAVVEAADQLPAPVSLCGWSMGGLVALLASQQVQPHSLILIEPSAPAEIQGVHPEVELVLGTFDPEQVYGRFPPGQPARAESSLARAQRKRGIPVPSLLCPTLVVYGREFLEERGRAIARLYNAEELDFPDLDHWGLITDARIPQAIAQYLAGK